MNDRILNKITKSRGQVPSVNNFSFTVYKHLIQIINLAGKKLKKNGFQNQLT